MKKQMLLLVLAMWCQWAMAQSVGLRTVTEVSDKELANISTGLGVYMSFNNFFDRFEPLVYGDYTRKKEELKRTESTIESYRRHSVGVAGLYRFPVSRKVDFKLGPALSYTWVNAFKRGNFSQWYQDYSADYAGLGAVTNLHVHDIFQLPINFDLFITPNYLLKANGEESTQAYSSLKQLNLQVGISYYVYQK